MKLNFDCIRDIMICIEKNEFGKELTLDQLNSLLPKYSENELHYTCLKLEEGNLLNILTVPIMGQSFPDIKYISDLTFYGHEFLEDIRSDNVWGKTKEVAKNIGATSLASLKEIATCVILELIKSQFIQ